MTLWQRFEQALLGPIYASAMMLRSVVWRLRRPMLIGVRALVVRNGEVLLIRHRAGRTPWALPGGGVERYERMAEAAAREAAEESGVQMHNLQFLGLYDRFGKGVSNYIGVFVGETNDEPQPPRSLEIAEARFFAPNALPPGTDEGSRRRIVEYVRGELSLYREW